jgi:DNA-binding NtrC family response regulator
MQVCGNVMDWNGFSLKDAQKQLEASFNRRVLEENGGTKSKAALLLEIGCPSLLNKIKEFAIYKIISPFPKKDNQGEVNFSTASSA